MVTYKRQTREEELINALETVASMTTSDIVNVVFKYMNVTKQLKEENRRLKEDMAENEATYEKIIKDLKGENNEQN